MPACKYILLPKFRSLTNYYFYPGLGAMASMSLKRRAVNTDLKARRAVTTDLKVHRAVNTDLKVRRLTAPYSDFVSLLYEHLVIVYKPFEFTCKIL